MKDRADLPWLEARNQATGLLRRDSDKVNVSARSLRHHLGHDRQRAMGPGPMINRDPPQGSSSSAESGVCPNLSRYGFEAFLLRLLTAPRSMTMSCSYVRPSTSIDRNPRNRTSITCHRSPQRRAPRASRNSYSTNWPPWTRRSGIRWPRSCGRLLRPPPHYLTVVHRPHAGAAGALPRPGRPAYLMITGAGEFPASSRGT